MLRMNKVVLIKPESVVSITDTWAVSRAVQVPKMILFIIFLQVFCISVQSPYISIWEKYGLF